MAGSFTSLSDGEVRRLADRFGLGALRSWRPVPAGTINSNYALDADAGRFFLRVNEGKRDEDVDYEAALVEALAAAGVPAPPPRRSVDGAPWVRHAGRQVSVFPWVPGTHRGSRCIEPAHARAAGEALARLHRAGLELGAGFERAGIYTQADIDRRYLGFADSADAELAPAIEALAGELARLEAAAAARRAAPRGVIHGDLFPDNVLFAAGDRIAALIDFEQASSGSLVYDLAVCANAWCFADDLVPARLAALVAGYRAERALDEAEQAVLHTELRAAAVRFLVTRITDVHLPGVDRPGKDFRRYLMRLERWRALGEDGLRALLASALR